MPQAFQVHGAHSRVSHSPLSPNKAPPLGRVVAILLSLLAKEGVQKMGLGGVGGAAREGSAGPPALFMLCAAYALGFGL